MIYKESLAPLFEEMLNSANSDVPERKFSALLYALQIPGIYARRDFLPSAENTGKGPAAAKNPQILFQTGGRPLDGNLYVAWLRAHSFAFKRWHYTVMPEERLYHNIYETRSIVTHTGRLNEAGAPIMFVDGTLNDVYYIRGKLYICLLLSFVMQCLQRSTGGNTFRVV